MISPTIYYKWIFIIFEKQEISVVFDLKYWVNTVFTILFICLSNFFYLYCISIVYLLWSVDAVVSSRPCNDLELCLRSNEKSLWTWWRKVVSIEELQHFPPHNEPKTIHNLFIEIDFMRFTLFYIVQSFNENIIVVCTW